MDRFNPDFLNDLITNILNAAADGTKLNINNADEVGQYVLTVLSLGAGLIPVIGSSLSALCNLLGTVLFSPNAMEQIWDALRARIEQLIDQKIEEYHLNILKEEIRGFQDNIDLYSTFLKDFEHAQGTEEAEAAGETVRMTHMSFLHVLIAAIPKFQDETYAVASLPLFSLVATMHLTLLADGIQRGKGWGYPDINIETFRTQFKDKTVPKLMPDKQKSLLLPGSMLKGAISRGVKAGVPTKVIDTWKKAYAALYESDSAPKGGDQDLDYVSYAIKIYHQGRKALKLEGGKDYEGYKVAHNHRVCSDYDSSMVRNVLNYTKLWPFMAGDVWTTDASRPVDFEIPYGDIDREIFYGPYGRWADNASWSLSDPPPVTDRGDSITAINVRAWDDIDGLEVKHGSSWDGFQGNRTGGTAEELDMGKDEYVTSVSIKYGFKLGSLVFTTNKNNKLDKGDARHADTVQDVAPAGYALSSVIITRWVGDTPTGCEGVILGFRPLMTDTTRS